MSQSKWWSLEWLRHLAKQLGKVLTSCFSIIACCCNSVVWSIADLLVTSNSGIPKPEASVYVEISSSSSEKQSPPSKVIKYLGWNLPDYCFEPKNSNKVWYIRTWIQLWPGGSAGWIIAINLILCYYTSYCWNFLLFSKLKGPVSKSI